MKNGYKKILSNELTIRQIILAATKKGDYDTSRAGLDVYPTIFENYLKIIPQYQWFSDKFLAKLLEDLRSYAAEKIQSTDTIFLDDLFGAIKRSGQIFIKNTPSFDGSWEYNEQLGVCIGYLGEFGVTLLEKNQYDSTANAIRAMGELGKLSCSKYYYDHGAADTILNIAVTAMPTKNPFISSVAMHQSFIIIKELIKNTALNAITLNIEKLLEMLEKFAEARMSSMPMIGAFYKNCKQRSNTLCNRGNLNKKFRS